MIDHRRGRQDIKELFAVFFLFAVPFAQRLKLYPGFGSQEPQCFAKIDVADLGHKREYVSARAACSKAVPGLRLGKDDKGRRLFSVKRAKSLVIAPCFLQRNVLGNNIDDIKS